MVRYSGLGDLLPRAGHPSKAMYTVAKENVTPARITVRTAKLVKTCGGGAGSGKGVRLNRKMQFNILCATKNSIQNIDTQKSIIEGGGGLKLMKNKKYSFRRSFAVLVRYRKIGCHVFFPLGGGSLLEDVQ